MIDKRLGLGGFFGGIGLGIVVLTSPSMSGALRDFTKGILGIPSESSEQGRATEKQPVTANVAIEGTPATSPAVGPGADQDPIPAAVLAASAPRSSPQDLLAQEALALLSRPHSRRDELLALEILAQIRSQNAGYVASATELPSSMPPNSKTAGLNPQTTDRADESTSLASDSAQPTDMQNSGDNADSQALTQREAAGVIGAPLLAAFISLIPVVLVYGAILGQPPITRTRKYAAWASTTAVLAYMAILNDLCLGRFGDATIGKAVGFGLWAGIFTVSAYLFGKYREKSARYPQISPQDTPARELGATNPSPTGADEVITPDSALLLTQKCEMSGASKGSQIDREKAAMNNEQRRIIVIVLFAVATVLIFSFIRMGSAIDYHSSMMIIKLSDVDNPNSYLPYQSNTIAWGVVARMGVPGILLGIVLPMILVFAALFIKRGN